MNLLLFVLDDLFVLCLVWLKIKENNYWVGLLLPFHEGSKCMFLFVLEWDPLPAVSADVCIFKNICFVIRSKVKIGIFLKLHAWF